MSNQKTDKRTGKKITNNESGKAVQIAITVALCAVLLILVAVLGFNYISARRDEAASASAAEGTDYVSSAGGDESAAGAQSTEAVEKWQEGVISYNGKKYIYNENLKTILFMGVDRSGVVTTSEDYKSGGQSDAMFLLVVDNDNQKIKIVAINRNCMTDIDLYTENGTYYATEKYQICLQHAFGDGKRLSCDRTVDAVSKLFYNIPISGYLAMNMDGITVMNDALGGIEVEVLEDLDGYGITLTEGETVTLKGDAAELYLRGRDLNEFDSASGRLKRQQQYLIALANRLTEAAKSDDEDEQQMALNAYDAVSDYVVSSVDFSSLVSEIAGYSFDDSDMYSVPGTTQMGEKWEEYVVDEEGLYDLIINVFYQEVQ
jgi:LCP family protein required for cell wall assembly